MITFLWNSQRVLLQNPEFGDELHAKLNVILRRSMNKTPYSFVHVPNERVLSFNFQKLSRNQVRNYFNLMRVSQGKDVTIIDHNGQRWYGNIVSEPVESTHNGINDSSL